MTKRMLQMTNPEIRTANSHTFWYDDTCDSTMHYTTPDSITVTVDGSDSITLTEPEFNLDNILTIENPASIKIGDTELNEDDLRKLKAVIDVIQGLDDNADLKAMFNTQIALNKIKEKDETESNKG